LASRPPRFFICRSMRDVVVERYDVAPPSRTGPVNGAPGRTRATHRESGRSQEAGPTCRTRSRR
jgi:hypothetical protein